MRLNAFLCKLFFTMYCFIAVVHAQNNEATYSEIKDDEFVVFFRTSAWLDEDHSTWHVPVHGWIYEPQDSTTRKAALATILESQYGLAPSARTEANFDRRVNLLLADSERDKRIVVRVGKRNHVLEPSSADGHFRTTLEISVDEMSGIADADQVRFSAVTRNSELRNFYGQVRLVPPTGLSIISDIDDTVKVSNVRDHKLLFEHTFFLDFTAVPGMADLYDAWSDQGASFHFVSSSPWQLYSPLQTFVDAEHFPWSTFSLKSVRFRDETLLNLLQEGTKTKPLQIEPILHTYPGRKFILVGDSGEQDPEVYTALIRKHPDQIVKIYIRNVTKEAADGERFKTLFEDIDTTRWALFDDTSTIEISTRE